MVVFNGAFMAGTTTLKAQLTLTFAQGEGVISLLDETHLPKIFFYSQWKWVVNRKGRSWL